MTARRGQGSGAAVADPSWLRPVLPVATCVLLVSAVAHVRVPLLPAIGDGLTLSATQLGVAVTLFGLGRLALDLPAGRLADRFLPVRMMGASAFAMALGSAGVAGAQSGVLLMASFLLMGAASATANTTGMTSLSGAAPPERRGAAMALYSGCLLTGQALGPALSGAVAGLGSWRAAAATGAVLGLLVAVVSLTWRPRVGASAGARSGRAPHGPPLTTLQRTVVSAVGFAVFLTVGAMPQTVLPLVGAEELGLSVTAIGLAIGLGGLARIVSAFAVGIVSDRVSRRAALLPCLALQTAGVLVLAIHAGTAWWLAAIVLMSLGASAHSVSATVLADRTDPASLGRSLGEFRFSADLGLVVGPALAAVVFETWGRSAAVLALASFLVLITAAAALVLPETGARAERRDAAARGA